MKYISSDTNVWLDFHAISRIDLPFRLKCTYVMYREALEREIIDPPDLLRELSKLGLESVGLTIDEFEAAGSYAGKYVKLSGYDRVALAIAKCRDMPLLTGDNALRKAAEKEGVPVIGTIGLLTELYDEKEINKKEYLGCLKALKDHPERRLPADLIQEMIDELM